LSGMTAEFKSRLFSKIPQNGYCYIGGVMGAEDDVRDDELNRVREEGFELVLTGETLDDPRYMYLDHYLYRRTSPAATKNIYELALASAMHIDMLETALPLRHHHRLVRDVHDQTLDSLRARRRVGTQAVLFLLAEYGEVRVATKELSEGARKFFAWVGFVEEGQYVYLGEEQYEQLALRHQEMRLQYIETETADNAVIVQTGWLDEAPQGSENLLGHGAAELGWMCTRLDEAWGYQGGVRLAVAQDSIETVLLGQFAGVEEVSFPEAFSSKTVDAILLPRLAPGEYTPQTLAIILDALPRTTDDEFSEEVYTDAELIVSFDWTVSDETIAATQKELQDAFALLGTEEELKMKV